MRLVTKLKYIFKSPTTGPVQYEELVLVAAALAEVRLTTGEAL